MTVELRTMPDAAIAPWRARQSAGYIAERIRAGESEEVARRKAAESDEKYFPGGRPGARQQVYEVIDDQTVVGEVWIGMLSDDDPGQWWVFTIEIGESHRDRGYGRAAMLLAAREAARSGATRLGLNVFGKNTVARGLYESLGYEPTSLQLAKDL